MNATLVSSERSIHQDPERVLLELWLSLSETERAKQFLDCHAAAHMIGVSQRTIRLWIETGCVQAVQIAKKYRIQSESLERLRQKAGAPLGALPFV